MKTEHTPLPWTIHDTSLTHKKGRVFIVGDALMLAELPKWGGDLRGKDVKNAEFIVRAVNSHEASLGAMRRARQWLGASGDEGDISICAELDKAITQAEGKP